MSETIIPKVERDEILVHIRALRQEIEHKTKKKTEEELRVKKEKQETLLKL